MAKVIDTVSGREIIVEPETYHIWETEGLDNETVISEKHLNAIRNRASIEEVIEFANKVRQAGGGDIIEELIPSEPEDPNSCLIANALNFDCEVNYNEAGDWHMVVYDFQTGINIAENLDLEYSSSEDDNVVWINLPEDIGLVAEAFDSYQDAELEQYIWKSQ